MFRLPCKVVGLYTFLETYCFLDRTLARLTYNVRAAWRSGGFHYRSCGLLPFNFALPFLRGYCRRCAKPPVMCWHFVVCVKLFHSQRNLCFIGTKRIPFFCCSVSVATNPNLSYASTAYSEEFTDISEQSSFFA